MPRHRETRFFPYDADALYAVVADIERYPEFLPGCRSLRVISRARHGEGEVVLADMSVGLGPVSESYRSRVTLDPVRRCIDVVQDCGPLRELDAHWRFQPQKNGTLVDFSIVFGFKSAIANAAVARVFPQVAGQISQAFAQRAARLAAESC